ncbi:hypothetical protein A3K63_04020 [Candidatus Micrarchaeota archaeon RBG_16_49_10]|nr:MAG: hypothetical protein A3K63_04020 [Candidatus Micrarchaeota archaeon RBG_16_49_10]
MAEVEYETLKAEEIDFGNNNFIEVARKKAISEKGENEFVSISRGFKFPDGTKRYVKSFTVPQEIVEKVAEQLKKMKA